MDFKALQTFLDPLDVGDSERPEIKSALTGATDELDPESLFGRNVIGLESVKFETISETDKYAQMTISLSASSITALFQGAP